MTKLNKVEKPTSPKEKTIDRSKLGRRSKNKGASYERTIAEKFKSFFGISLVRTPQSGGFAKNIEKAEEFRGDIVSADKDTFLKLHIECKNQKSWSLPAWLTQAQSDCPSNRKPLVVFHKHGTGEDYVCLSLKDFMELVDPTQVYEKKVK